MKINHSNAVVHEVFLPLRFSLTGFTSLSSKPFSSAKAVTVTLAKAGLLILLLGISSVPSIAIAISAAPIVHLFRIV